MIREPRPPGRVRAAPAATAQGDGHQVVPLAERGRHQIPVPRGAVPAVHEENRRAPSASPFDAMQTQAVRFDEALGESSSACRRPQAATSPSLRNQQDSPLELLLHHQPVHARRLVERKPLGDERPQLARADERDRVGELGAGGARGAEQGYALQEQPRRVEGDGVARQLADQHGARAAGGGA